MENFESLSHVRWECKYHVVFIPKYRRKVIYGKLRSAIGRIIRDLCQQTGVEVLEGHAMADHIHVCLKIPPKYSVSLTTNQPQRGFRHANAPLRGASQSHGLRPWLITSNPPDMR